jgi:hypothetical protein
MLLAYICSEPQWCNLLECTAVLNSFRMHLSCCRRQAQTQPWLQVSYGTGTKDANLVHDGAFETSYSFVWHLRLKV